MTWRARGRQFERGLGPRHRNAHLLRLSAVLNVAANDEGSRELERDATWKTCHGEDSAKRGPGEDAREAASSFLLQAQSGRPYWTLRGTFLESTAVNPAQ